jgi:signal transduction histidine kinase
MKRHLILNVDDHPINRYLRSKHLAIDEFEIIEAATGEGAFRIACEQSPALVLLDVNLPDIDGTAVCKRIKTDPRTQGIMVLQISASAVEISDAVRGLEGGADAYLVEPVEPELLVAHVRSLLRLRESELTLRRLNDRLQQFAFLASHDLQEPLRVIMLYSQLLEEVKGNFTPREQMLLDRVTEGAHRMHLLIGDLLAYSKATIMELESTPVALSTCYNHAISALAGAMEGLQVNLTCDPLPWVEGDSVGLTQVFQNILSNAIKYRRGNEVQVHVTAVQQSRKVVVSIADAGQGFNPSYAEHVFGVFKRLHGQDTSGSGIGLALCRTIVERHGGRIWAQSEPGKGSVFFFSVPSAGAAAGGS